MQSKFPSCEGSLSALVVVVRSDFFHICAFFVVCVQINRRIFALQSSGTQLYTYWHEGRKWHTVLLRKLFCFAQHSIRIILSSVCLKLQGCSLCGTCEVQFRHNFDLYVFSLLMLFNLVSNSLWPQHIISFQRFEWFRRIIAKYHKVQIHWMRICIFSALSFRSKAWGII